MPFSTEVLEPETRPNLLPKEDHWPSPRLRWVLRGLMITALAGATYLAVVALGGERQVFGCAGLPAIDCDNVLAGRWSGWLGMPVSVPAIAVYATLLGLSFLIVPSIPFRVRRMARRATVVLSVAAAGAGLWFVGVMIVAEGKICIYCLAIHFCGFWLVGLIFKTMPLRLVKMTREEYLGSVRSSMGIGGSKLKRTDRGLLTLPDVLVAIGIGLTSLSPLIAGQVLMAPDQFSVEEYREIVERIDLASPESIDYGAARRQGSERWRQPVVVRETDPPWKSPIFEDPPTPGLPLEGTTNQNDPTTRDSSSGDRFPSNASASATSSEPRWIKILDGEERINMHGQPVLGDPEAEFVVVKLFDYTCKHCRRLETCLEDARQRYGDQFAVVLIPVPMSTRCNRLIEETAPEHRNACRYAQTAMAVWHAAPKEFESLHAWLMQGDEPPEYAELQARAESILGPDTLEEVRLGKAVREQIAAGVNLYRKCGRGGIPKLLFGKYVINVRYATSRQVFKILEEHTDIRPK